jgi:hypothetical protein
MVLLNFLDDGQFVQLITASGKSANLATIMDSLNIDFCYDVLSTFVLACKIHSLNPLGERFSLTVVQIV